MSHVGRVHCTAKSKRTGKRCGALAMANGKCYHHGGAALKGIAAPRFKHGRYSKYCYCPRIFWRNSPPPELASGRHGARPSGVKPGGPRATV
jgi:hypothetical protein